MPQPFKEIQNRYRDYIPVYTDESRNENSVACATSFPSNTVYSTIFPDSASVIRLLLKPGQSLNRWKKIKMYLHQNILFLLRFMMVSPSFTIYEAGSFITLAIGTLFILGTQPCWHQGQ